MSNTTLDSALAHVANVLSSSEYISKEVFIIIPDILLVDATAADRYFGDFNKVSTFSLANEPGSLKFCAFRPYGEQNRNQIWALEHFDSESSLAEHRKSAPLHDMMSWLMNENPNGDHPLPVPVPLQTIGSSLLRPVLNKVQAPFVVITRIAVEVARVTDVVSKIEEYVQELKDDEDVLMLLPGKTDKEVWLVAAYSDQQTFAVKGFVETKARDSASSLGIRGWNEYPLQLKAGYLSRP